MTDSTFDSQTWSEIIQDLSQKGIAQVDDPLRWQSWKNLAESLYEQNKFSPAQIGRQQTQKRESSIRGDWTYWINSKSEKELEINQFLENIKINLAAELRISLVSFEAHFAFYPPGQAYHRHYDQAPGIPDRQITFIHYLNENWTEEDGGELLVYENQQSQKELYKISPRGGRWVFFRTELFPHEVMPSIRTRKSLTGWFRSRSKEVLR